MNVKFVSVTSLDNHLVGIDEDGAIWRQNRIGGWTKIEGPILPPVPEPQPLGVQAGDVAGTEDHA